MFRLALLLAVSTSCYARMAYRLSAGVDFGRENPYIKEFRCADYPFGFYADVTNNCDLFHVCEPVYDENDNYVSTAQYTFACGSGTVFSQVELACNHYRIASPCEEAVSIYESSNIGSGVYNSRYVDESEEEEIRNKVREERRLDVEEVREEIEEEVEEEEIGGDIPNYEYEE
ncbi:UNVERIFIED_CONTAM: hypothetical protein GTU68_040035 [Idotea baltica]|nr:hypothetical protein [Idotea baltica]